MFDVAVFAKLTEVDECYEKGGNIVSIKMLFKPLAVSEPVRVLLQPRPDLLLILITHCVHQFHDL